MKGDNHENIIAGKTAVCNDCGNEFVRLHHLALVG
jgi:hypothetical protein